jgi:hypothetical protein
MVKNAILSLKPWVNFEHFFNISVVIPATHCIMYVMRRNRLLRVFEALEKQIYLQKTPKMGENCQRTYF